MVARIGSPVLESLPHLQCVLENSYRPSVDQGRAGGFFIKVENNTLFCLRATELKLKA